MVRNSTHLATKTRPDLCVATSMLGFQAAAPTMKHMQEPNRPLRYLKGSCSNGIIIRPAQNKQLSAFVDASWGSDTERNQKSRTGYMILHGQAVIYVSSTLQKSVSLCSTEAESVALSEACKVIF